MDVAPVGTVGQALARARVVGELMAAVSELASLAVEAVLPRLKLTSTIRDLLEQLGAPPVDPEADPLSDDPNDPNYRYRDTGYIADSRKERALQMIRMARDSGTQLRATDIDWDTLEKNGRQAKDLIVKSNLFGKVDWTALGEAGMASAAGFLIDRVYASIAPEPVEDSAQARKDYALGLETLRTRMEACTTIDHVLELIDEIRDERAGTMLDAGETERYAELHASWYAGNVRRRDIAEVARQLYGAAIDARAIADKATWDIERRQRQRHAVSQSARDAAAEARQLSDNAWATWAAHTAANAAELNSIAEESKRLADEQRAINAAATARNKAENAITRAWATFGPRFDAVLNFRSRHRGSDAFVSHVVNAKTGKLEDWAWAEKERVAIDRATKQEVAFQLNVADSFERRGGRPVNVDSTLAIKKAFGFREVQSGNWVLRDPNSARFHVEQTAGAMSDLSDIVGIASEHLGLGGRLGMAFGARGSGGKNAARAHYEPVQRVINLTKLGGGGCLAHEYFHAVDNLLGELANEKASGKSAFFTKTPEVLESPALRDAAIGLRAALLEGTCRTPQEVKFTERDTRLAKLNFEKPSNALAHQVKGSGNATAAVIAVDAYFGNQRNSKSWTQWRRMAAAYYAPPAALAVMVDAGPPVSSFAYEAMKLDKQQAGKYWSQTVELAARAFQAWVEDRLEKDDRKNGYLSDGANNGGYSSGVKPYPEGEERERINAAFEKLFGEIRAAQVFEKASVNQVLLDSVFGAQNTAEA